jgi:ElaB/YqjD/DUF883 family membrane-anchored ribosome-binding protein
MEHAGTAAHALASLEEPLERAVAALEPGATAIRDELVRADRTLKQLARTHPLATLAGAALAGYLLGRLISRR